VIEQLTMFEGGYWFATIDGDRRAMQLFKRHYPYRPYADGRPRTLFVGPGEKMVLLTHTFDALFVWRKFISMDHQDGVNCSIFRNESDVLASDLIKEAMQLAWQRWPGERLYTYVNPRKVQRSRTPGRCFLKASWQYCGLTKRGLIVLEAHDVQDVEEGR
jgi:hypothetical protein